VRDAFFSRDSLLLYAVRSHRRRRRLYPEQLARYNVVRLRSQRKIDRFLAGVEPQHVKGS
jgi:hypothetical protein